MQQQIGCEKIYTCTSIKYDEDGNHSDPHFGSWCDECGFDALAGDRFECQGVDKDDTICDITLCYDCYCEDAQDGCEE